MKDVLVFGKNKLPCGHSTTEVIGIEYWYDHPDHYDGISEYRCGKCGRRWGRWSRRELDNGETERVYGYGDICESATIH